MCAATRVALPARFLWEAYRGMLGPERVPTPLALRQGRADLAPDAPAARAAAPRTSSRRCATSSPDGDPERRLQLAERLADLYDQYQVYRADWLADWAEGRDQLRRPGRRAGAAGARPVLAGQPVARDPRQPAARARAGRAAPPSTSSSWPRSRRTAQPALRLPRRVVLFGMSTLPYQTIAGAGRPVAPHPGAAGGAESLPVLLGRHHRRAASCCSAAYRRHQPRDGSDLAEIPVEELHAHSHPLLASWGRQGRDFVRMLDEFDGGAGRADSPTCGSTCSTRTTGETLLRPGAGRGARPAAAGRASARAAGPGRPLDRIPRRPQRPARGRGAARPAAVLVRRRDATSRCARATWW